MTYCLFSLCGFSNPISLKDCTDEDISTVAKFMREEWAPIMQKKCNDKNYNNQMVDCFGELYWENPTQFDFMHGHKKTIKGLASYVKSIVESGEYGFKYFKKNESANECVADSNQTEPQQSSIQSNCINIPDNARHTHYFLNRLQATAKRNESRKIGGYRYDDDIKYIGLYLRLLAGPLAYETIQKNMECSLPSLVSTNRYIRSFGCNIVEGVVRSSELQKYLNDRKLPPFVCLSLDETRVEDQVQYDAKTNQIVGFTLPLDETTGLPIPCAYPARNAEDILEHFSIENNISCNLNVVMAQPIAQNVPPFCLLAYGTDKRYNATHVINQWKFLTKQLELLNIKVLTISSDSDPKYNAAMRFYSKLGTPSESIRLPWFFSAANDDGPFCIQDTEHIIAKLRAFLLRTIYNRRKLPFGKNKYIKIKDMYYIMDHYKKDRHELTNSVFNLTDKQNIKSALKMCSEKVTNLLKLYPNFESTVHFLETMRDIYDAFRVKSLEPLERIGKMFFRMFLLRLWRRYILRNPHYTLEKNFLTTYTYACIELNGHSLVQTILYLRKINRPEMFLPHLLGSQQCESSFRQLRSLSSTYSTVVNCSTKEALSRLSKIQIQNDIMQICSNFKYPRHEAKNKLLAETFPLPSLKEIECVIKKCATDATDLGLKLNFISKNDLNDKELLSCKINPYSPPPNDADVEPKAKKNINHLKVSDFDGITLKNFSSKKSVVDETGPYVELLFNRNSKRIVVRKSSLVWLLRKDKQRMSSDRLRRVQCPTKTRFAAKKKKSGQIMPTTKIISYPLKNLRKRKI